MEIPAGLGERGSHLYRSLQSGDARHDALALEAARTADRLDELDNIIQGKGVLDLMQFRLDLPSEDDGPYSIEVKFGAPLAEARQQGMALTSFLKALGLGDAAQSIREEPASPSKTPLELLQSRLKA